MNMSTAFLIAGYGFALLGLWQGPLASVVGAFYIAGFLVSTIAVMGTEKVITGEGFLWYAIFAAADLALAAVLHYVGWGLSASLAAAVLITTCCITAYAGREGGFLLHKYSEITAILNTLFIFLVANQLWLNR